MSKYKIFSLESFEYVIERQVTFLIALGRPWQSTINYDAISLDELPINALIAGSPKIKCFLFKKKAEKWIEERCNLVSSTSKKEMFIIEPY